MQAEFIPYVQGTVSSPLINKIYAELKEHVDETHGLLSALGTFWSESYGDLSRSQTAYDTIVHTVAGCVLPLSDAYRGLLDTVLEASIQTIPVFRDKQLELVIFSQDDDKTVMKETTVFHDGEERKAYVFYRTPLLYADYFTATLLNDDVVLKNGTHFTIDEKTGDVTFFVDIFNDPAVIQGAYGEFNAIDSPNRSIMLWGVNVVQRSTRIWERYGQLVYRKAYDSDKYKAYITALMFYYTNMKTARNVENVMNILYGVPFVYHDGEVVQEIYDVGPDLTRASVSDEEDSNYHCVVTLDGTETRRYYVYGMADLTVNVGDTLTQYQLLGRMHEVYDYIQLERDAAKFIPATAHPENMTKDEQIQYVYEHWNDSDGNTPFGGGGGAEEDDKIVLTPELRADIIRYVLKYNSLFIKHVIDIQSISTYQHQIEEIRKLLRSGLPVYLNPLLETVFRLRLSERIPTDAELIEDAKLPEKDQRFGPDWADEHACVLDGTNKMDATLRLEDRHRGNGDFYGGEYHYNGGACIDHSSDGEDYTLYYDGYALYNDRYLHKPEQVRSRLSYGGSLTYGRCFELVHNAEFDPIEIVGMRMGISDEFPYSDKMGTLLRPIYYDAEFTHDDVVKYGPSHIVPPDMRICISMQFDEHASLSEMFTLEAASSHGYAADFSEQILPDDAFTVRLRRRVDLSDDVLSGDDAFTADASMRFESQASTAQDDMSLTQA